MADTSAHPVDPVLAPVPLSHWVFGLPHRLRYPLAWGGQRIAAVQGTVPTGPRAGQRLQRRLCDPATGRRFTSGIGPRTYYEAGCGPTRIREVVKGTVRMLERMAANHMRSAQSIYLASANPR